MTQNGFLLKSSERSTSPPSAIQLAPAIAGTDPTGCSSRAPVQQRDVAGGLAAKGSHLLGVRARDNRSCGSVSRDG